jgi:hypothetical protein
VVDRPANLSTLGLGLLQHRVEDLGLNPEGDVQIQRVLALEVEGRAGHLEEGEAGAVIHRVLADEVFAAGRLEKALAGLVDFSGPGRRIFSQNLAALVECMAWVVRTSPAGSARVSLPAARSACTGSLQLQG